MCFRLKIILEEFVRSQKGEVLNCWWALREIAFSLVMLKWVLIRLCWGTPRKFGGLQLIRLYRSLRPQDTTDCCRCGTA